MGVGPHRTQPGTAGSNFLPVDASVIMALAVLADGDHGVRRLQARLPGAPVRRLEAIVHPVPVPVHPRRQTHDTEVDRAARRGVAVLGTLGSNDEWPEFANDKGGFKLDKWEEYVGQVVSHYRGRVRAWEIWNEPNYEFAPDYYAQMLKRGAEAIKRADPSASVVAIGGAPEPEYAERVFEQLHKQYPQWERSKFIAVISMHMYPARSEQEPTGPEIPFACPFCGEAYQVSEDLAGKKISCRNCREPCRVETPQKKKKKRRARSKFSWLLLVLGVVLAVFFLAVGVLLGRLFR